MTHPPPVTAVVFDLDGTLTDSAPGIYASYRHALARYGRTATDDELRPCIGPPLAVSLARLGVAPADVAGALAAYRSYFGATGIYDNSLYPSIADLLRRLRSADLVLALATSKRQDFAERILDMFDLTEMFDTVAGATEDGARTEKTEIVRFALDQLGLTDPATAVVVGDRRDDVLAARALGARHVAVTWGYGSPEELGQAGATHYAADPEQLRHWIRTFSGRPEL